MFCRYCYTQLDPDRSFTCPRCHGAYVADDPRTFLARPFPPKSRIIWHLVKTTLITIAVACPVAFFQRAAASGH
jgi:hypothetical protein